MADLIKKSMRLFGMPYQFDKSIDPRIDGLSTTIGQNFVENIVRNAPICYFIPGDPEYLPGKSTDKKVSATAQFFENGAGGFKSLKEFITNSTDDDIRLYSLKRNYTDYMKDVNVLCRFGATALELNTSLDGTYLQQYDWRNYRQDSASYTTVTDRVTDNLVSSIRKGINQVSKSVTGKNMLYDSYSGSDASIEDVLSNKNYVQFYVDPDVTSGESMSNSTGESQLKSALDQGSNILKEVAFMANAGGVDAGSMQEFAGDAMSGLNTGLQAILGNNRISGSLSRIINLGSGVIKGENIIMPDVYQSSSYSKSYSITIHLRTPYGNKLGYYFDIYVPLMHILALGLPQQKSANSYGAPRLVKCYVDGVFSCNMGMVSSISIQKVGDVSAAGLPTAVDVNIDITDLYSDLSVTPSSSPIMFVNNSSLIEYLSTSCGLSLINPNMKTKVDNIVNTVKNSFTSIPDNISSSIKEAIDNEISKFIGLR